MGKTKKTFAMIGEPLAEAALENVKQFAAHQEENTRELLAKQDEQKKSLSSADFMNTTFEPFEDRVLMYPDPIEEKTKGGLYKPEVATAKERPLLGTVVKVGPGKENAIVKKALPLKPGERVYFGNYAGTPITPSNGVEYLVMRFSDIFGRE